MVFGSGLLLMALLLSGGQPILPDVERNMAMESEIGSPCPDSSGKKTYNDCKNTCPTSIIKLDGVYKFVRCDYDSFMGFKGIICNFKNEKTGEPDAWAQFCDPK